MSVDTRCSVPVGAAAQSHDTARAYDGVPGSELAVAGRSLQILKDGALVDGVRVRLTPAPLSILTALAARPGHVLSRAELMGCLPSGQAAHEHAVEAAVARLRAAVGTDLVHTVVKRGYRLAMEGQP